MYKVPFLDWTMAFTKHSWFYLFQFCSFPHSQSKYVRSKSTNCRSRIRKPQNNQMHAAHEIPKVNNCNNALQIKTKTNSIYFFIKSVCAAVLQRRKICFETRHNWHSKQKYLFFINRCLLKLYHGIRWKYW